MRAFKPYADEVGAVFFHTYFCHFRRVIQEISPLGAQYLRILRADPVKDLKGHQGPVFHGSFEVKEGHGSISAYGIGAAPRASFCICGAEGDFVNTLLAGLFPDGQRLYGCYALPCSGPGYLPCRLIIYGLIEIHRCSYLVRQPRFRKPFAQDIDDIAHDILGKGLFDFSLDLFDELCL